PVAATPLPAGQPDRSAGWRDAGRVDADRGRLALPRGFRQEAEHGAVPRHALWPRLGARQCLGQTRAQPVCLHLRLFRG
nr:hypothetical protein [Tanacetum cinerariifolium]